MPPIQTKVTYFLLTSEVQASASVPVRARSSRYGGGTASDSAANASFKATCAAEETPVLCRIVKLAC